MNETLLPGKYYLGDPSYVLPSKIMIGIWENMYNLENGKFKIYDYDFVVYNTHNGDGTFTDTKKREYIVNSGIVGLVNVNLIDDMSLCNHGHIFNFNKIVNFIYDAGIFYIKSGKKYIQIDTRDIDEYDSEKEQHCENEDGEYISKTLLNDSDTDSIDNENEPNEKKPLFFKKF